eukprot:gene5122-10244_t
MSKNSKKSSGKSEEVEVSSPPSGSNIFLFQDGSQYDGEWIEVDGIKVREGKGILKIGPEEYSGNWNNDQMSGYGTYKFSSGAVYEGEFQKNQFDGQGEYRFPDGAIYRGGWRAGKMHGQGNYIDPKQIQWKGEFFNGMYDTGRSYISLRPSQDSL